MSNKMVVGCLATWSRLWGLIGVQVFLLSAVLRIFPHWQDVLAEKNGPVAYLALSVLLPGMIYLEGYRGFYKGFAPRVVSRSNALLRQNNLVYQLFAPLFCMGFIGSTLRRKINLSVVTLSIVGLVLWVKTLSQPWRWVIDLSVAAALFAGVLSIIWVACKDWSVTSSIKHDMEASLIDKTTRSRDGGLNGS